MKIRTFKEIGEDIDKLAPVTNKEAFDAALPLLIEMSDRIEKMNRCIRRHTEQMKALNEACSAYALDHVPSVFKNGLILDGRGVRHGDTLVNGTLYHFSAGYGSLIRTDGGQLTKDFLNGLPKEWIKTSFKLDETNIKTFGVTADELLEKGLVKSARDVWSLPAAVSDSCENSKE